MSHVFRGYDTMTIKISAEQYATLGRASFERRLLGIIRRNYGHPSADFSDEDLKKEIWQQVERAHQYGLKDELSAATFVLTAWLLGVNFDQRIPAIMQILNASELSSASKAQSLEDFTLSLFSALDQAASSANSGKAG